MEPCIVLGQIRQIGPTFFHIFQSFLHGINVFLRCPECSQSCQLCFNHDTEFQKLINIGHNQAGTQRRCFGNIGKIVDDGSEPLYPLDKAGAFQCLVGLPQSAAADAKLFAENGLIGENIACGDLAGDDMRADLIGQQVGRISLKVQTQFVKYLAFFFHVNPFPLPHFLKSAQLYHIWRKK